MKFSYVVAGWEGWAPDMRVLNSAFTGCYKLQVLKVNLVVATCAISYIHGEKPDDWIFKMYSQRIGFNQKIPSHLRKSNRHCSLLMLSIWTFLSRQTSWNIVHNCSIPLQPKYGVTIFMIFLLYVYLEHSPSGSPSIPRTILQWPGKLKLYEYEGPLIFTLQAAINEYDEDVGGIIGA